MQKIFDLLHEDDPIEMVLAEVHQVLIIFQRSMQC